MKRMISIGLFGLLVGAASAATVPFTESFTNGASNWRNSLGTVDALWLSVGGADGAGHIREDFSFAASAPGDQPLLLRGQSNYNSSGGAFVGNWIGEGVTSFHMFVRTNTPVPVNFYARFAAPNGGPGAVALEFAPVLPNTWTEIVVPLDPSNPQFIYEGTNFNSVFSNVGRIQMGILAPSQLIGDPSVYSFDLDEVSIVPEPGTLGALLLAAAMLARRR
ncbi:MAG: PEP-CTERM sorting domain-containing protein [Planctomycetes bacterium]|nr:PEP-CTERM sorting domain-containing protein [Planctomycetota bacterium]